MPGSHILARARSPLVAGVLLGTLILVGSILYANSGSRTPAGSTPVTGPAREVAVSLVEMRIVPSQLTVTAGEHLVLKVTNDGSMTHDLRLSNGKHTPLLSPGQSVLLDAGVITADLDGWCTVAGHRAAGMTMTITVDNAGHAMGGAGAGAGAGHAMGGAGASGVPGASGAADATSPDLTAAPGAGWTARDATLAPAAPGTVHEVTWTIKDIVAEVAPGVRQTLWTFDGQVPGPVLRGKVGDTFIVHVRNDTAMTHNIDFHAESGPPDVVMTPVPAGATHTYTFTATHAGAWLYHCGIAPMIQHMANGMYGALIVDPADLAPVSKEFVLVGSEFFFGPQGDIGDYQKMIEDRPDTVVFNGYPFAYMHQPLAATAGQPVRIWVVAAGPNRGLAFHVIGAPFSTSFLDGAYLVRPGDPSRGGAQVLAVAPGAGGFVELTFSQPGSYPFVTHMVSDSELGATGSFEVR